MADRVQAGDPRQTAKAIRRAAASAWAAGFAALIGAGAAPAATYTMTVAHLYPEDLTNNEATPALARFKLLVEAATGGDLEVKVFGAGAPLDFRST